MQRRKSFVESLKDLSPFSGPSSSSSGDASSSLLSDYNINCTAVQTSKHSPIERCNHSATIVGDNMVIYGGRDLETKSYFDDVFVLNLLTYEWTKPDLNGKIPSPRALHTSSLAGDGKTIIITGGSNDKVEFDEVFSLDCETWTFEMIFAGPDFPGGGLTGHSATLHDRKLYVFGGRLSLTERASSYLHTFDLDTKRWDKIEASGHIIPRAGHTSTLIQSRLRGDYILIFGGKNGDSTVDAKVVLFDIANQSWNLLEATGKSPGAARLFHSSVYAAPFLVILGGKREYSDEGLDSIYVLDTQYSRWAKIKLQSSFSVNGRFGHTMVQHGDTLVIFGGCHNKVCYNDVHELTIAR